MYTLAEGIKILERTPNVLNVLLGNIGDHWGRRKEGGESWSPFDIVGHLLHGEKKDWTERLHKILNEENKPFEPFDRFAQLKDNERRTMEEILAEFAELRAKNIQHLKSLAIKESDFDKKGMHPALGTVSLRNLLATWTVHDLNHLAQITRVMAHQYKQEVGPWKEYLPVLNIKKDE